ncbi:MAG: hypothetical protein JSV56_13330 [Methanomassiliicoccales archaeon]|nr:MAG: hypothetical protein JSV56_13330 [Methanomassiliicoccales archaeon]
MEEIKKIDDVSKVDEGIGSKMNITKEQAKYWYSVAKRDIAEGNREGAWNVYRWLKENNAWFHAKQLRMALKNAAQ